MRKNGPKGVTEWPTLRSPLAIRLAVSSSPYRVCNRMEPMESTLGAALSDISLPDTAGQPVRLGSLWADVPAIVVFLRHYV